MRTLCGALLGLGMLNACSSAVDQPQEADASTGPSSGDDSGDSGETGDSEEFGSSPFRDDWRTVVDQPFSTYAPDGTVSISSLVIGHASGDNFRNRGDVIVRYEDTDRIQVEMRRFTMAQGSELANDDFDRMSIWASTDTFPVPPYTLEPGSDCVDPQGTMPWKDGCQISVFYDGLTQLSRSGADLRVTLPRDFIFDLVVTTEDNAVDGDYQNRGHICVEDLPGSAELELDNGAAWVILAEDTPEMPECPEDLRVECEAASWDPDSCPCYLQGYAFSQVRVRSNDGQASDATVDIPGGEFWASYHLRNDGDGMTAGDPTPGGLCEATVDPSVGDVMPGEGVDLDLAPWVNLGMINFPGGTATVGAGFSIQLLSEACAEVQAIESPDGEQQAVERGNLHICSGCAREIGCDGLVPE